jgi:transglutaminase-like putative cysteine protease
VSIAWQIPRNCLAWILLAQIALVAPHAQRLPWWVLAAGIVSGLWRVMVYQGRWSLPPIGLKSILALCCFVGIFTSYGTMLGLEPTVALLFAGFFLKLLETSQKRDVYLLIFLAYFVALTAFLFSQDFSLALFILGTLLLISTAMVALHQHSYDRFSVVSLKKSALIFMQAVPLMVLLFLVFPRMQPLWSVPVPSHQAKTGMTDSMSPGDVSGLSQSSKLAFRVVFENAVPSKHDMYWRGLVMSRFDGRRWYQDLAAQVPLQPQQLNSLSAQINNPIAYRVIQEPTYQPWLFSLAFAFSDDKKIHIMSDYRLHRTEDVHTRSQYQVLSDKDFIMDETLNLRQRQLATALPAKGNPKARQLANQLWMNAKGPQDYIERILKLFRQQNFIYTLQPPLLGKESIDEFLFASRKGFCEHYASSFVFLMRAAGIPARVVAGYQGGEINPLTGTVLVHQFDAHAWAEVWLENKGWQRVDPTAAVSPLRIEYGLERALQQQEETFLSGSPLSPLRYRNIAWLNQLRLQVDAFSYYWSRWVLAYEGERQLTLLTQWLGAVTPWRLAAVLIGIGAIPLLLTALSLLNGRGALKPAAELKLYLRMCRRLEKAGWVRQANEGPMDFARRIVAQQPRGQQHLVNATRLFVSLSYEPLSQDEKALALQQLRREVLKVG